MARGIFFLASLLVMVSAGPTDRKTETPGDLEPVNDAAMCTDVQRIFTTKQIGISRQVPDSEVKGDHLELCPSNRSCCTKDMEESYKTAAKVDFQHRLQSSSSYLKTLISASSNQFLEKFQEMTRLAENNTHTLFSQTYKKMESVARLPTEQLFADLLAYLKGKDITVGQRVDSFFASLFPIVYHHIINPNLREFSNDYKECLKEKVAEIKPFGDKAKLVSLQIVRSLDVARILLQALNLGVEIINTTEHMDFGQECNKALVKLTYCAHCQRLVSVKPCSGFCLNVGHGCLAKIAELDKPWGDYVGALHRLTSGMSESSNIEKVMNLLDAKISEAIMHAMDDGPEVTKKVKNVCGHPKRSTRSSSEATDSEQETNGQIVTSRSVVSTWHVRLQNFVKKLSQSKGFYANLADDICNDETLAVKGESNCWNGNELGTYKKTIAGIGVAAQKYNPEITLAGTEEVVVTSLVDKLVHMRELLDSKVDSVPESDSLFIQEAGSGSGFYYNTIVDDEDYYDYYETNGSGSGDIWATEKEPDLHFSNKGSGTTEVPKTKDEGSASGRVFCNITAVICSLAFMVTLQFLTPL
ncbi:glypican-5-like isoform X2 [Limulus polyphemus]|uniref:Glypican-5-like isoform X2 n=1 Tax=Limulus polyphemus TaxID=6850 RepID=A0ABM1S8E1_LIMPO|nr:glypican-5-like isoform X2 [Limulus polyphemus]